MRWVRIFTVWLALAILMIGHGWLRQLLVVPLLGELRAHQLSCFTGALIILAVSVLLLGWMGAAGSPATQLRIGLVWLVTTVLFEFGFGHWVAGHSWERLLADYDLTAGRLWLLVLLATLLGPWLGGRLRVAWRLRAGGLRLRSRRARRSPPRSARRPPGGGASWSGSARRSRR